MDNPPFVQERLKKLNYSRIDSTSDLIIITRYYMEYKK